MDDQRGVSSVMGVVLLLGITLLVVTVILATSVIVLADAQSDARISQMENSMSQMSSKASLVALGESDSQSFNLGDVGGAEVEVRPDAGHLRIVYLRDNDTDETLFDDSLGALVYRNGDVEVAYQAGGVWKKQGRFSTMISPPEFYYRSATLTFPIVQIEGEYRKSGAVSGDIKQAEIEGKIYPNETHRNPLENGSIVAEIESEYYQGWHDFFDERTEGDIDIDHENKTTTVVLETESDIGVFDLYEGITSGGISDDPGVEVFNITLVSDEGPQGFTPVQYVSLHSEENEEGEDFEIIFRPANNESTGIEIIYQDDDRYEVWENDSTEFISEGPFGGEHPQDQYYELFVDLTSNSTTMEYTSSINATINNETYSTGDSVELGELVEYYLVSMEGTIDFGYDVNVHGQSSGIDDEASGGSFVYEPEGDIIQYLHVTNRTITIDE